MEHNKRHCPAVIGMYYYVDEITSPTEISKITGLSVSTVWEILKRKFGIGSTRVRRSDALMEEIERDYVEGVSTYEMADKYGVHHSTISKWMRKRDRQRGKGKSSKTKNCPVCGSVFSGYAHNAKYCSKKCCRKGQDNYSRSGGMRRAKRYGVAAEKGITPKSVYKRDNGICALCGGLCDFGDIRDGVVGPAYPTVDHIIPLSKGGPHTWDNVQLAHFFCNSVKRDVYNAEEQTA